VKAIEELMARTARYDEMDDLAISSITPISEAVAAKNAM
jgi:CheY-specific phosphatase CheX